MRSLFMERHIWTSHPYVAYTMVDKLFNPFTLLVGPCLVGYLVFKSTIPIDQGGYHLRWWNIILSYLVWLLCTRTAKLLPHLWYRPQDVVYVPAFILFGYYFAIMKLYALCTLHETGWGTRAGIGDASAATAAAAAQDSNEKQRQQQRAYGARQPLPQSAASYDSSLPLSYNISPSDPVSPFRDPSPFADAQQQQSEFPPPRQTQRLSSREVHMRTGPVSPGFQQRFNVPGQVHQRRESREQYQDLELETGVAR